MKRNEHDKAVRPPESPRDVERRRAEEADRSRARAPQPGEVKTKAVRPR